MITDRILVGRLGRSSTTRFLLLIFCLSIAACNSADRGDAVGDRVQPLLDRYAQAINLADRSMLLEQLAETGNPKAAVVLGEALNDPALDARIAATCGLLDNFLPNAVDGGTEQHMEAVTQWWKENEARLRHEADGS